MPLPAAAVFRHGGVMRGTVCGCGSDAAHRLLSAAGSGRLPSVRCSGRPFRNDCRSLSSCAGVRNTLLSRADARAHCLR
uniref:Uncharacterized protein n=1 Tax=Salmonella dublin TaxID=98360 RepID=Q4L1V0_SALDU|nr:hypothetical protein [Salmonella enterica subsp. enterica serovar Dublin]